ncbi:SwmB domain-containing protein [Paenibacillus sp. F6_3S_P_1C]|uniref:SwmB domain-containing protein n=1 Tax=Paenibacillus vandeheii TaxID=3035917 RepID=A0ABT8JHS5_9BACL|nr:SwmB domain-containing protein [Paenibacillus vandeheii]MDN4603719.1 SwmB domain-containing protein [Paenibacillus vandeheii]
MFVNKWARKGLVSLMIVMLVAQGWLTGWVGGSIAFAADDLTGKGIRATTPALNEQQASGSAPLTIEFIKPVKKVAATIEKISVRRVQDDSIVTEVPVTDAAVTVLADDAVADADLGRNVRIQLPASLPGGSFYVMIGSQSFVYGDGQPVEGLNKEWTFRTAGVGSAQVKAQSPLNAATNVTASANIQLTFDRAMKVGAGKMQIYRGSTLVEEIDANSSRISFNTDRKTVTVDPVNNWASNSTIYIEVPEGFLRDDLNNDMSTIQRTTWGFNVISDPTVLTVSSLSPSNGATGVSLSGEFTLTFNKELDRNFTSSATVKNANGGIVASTTLINTSNLRQLRIIPQTSLTSNTTYTIDIPANVFRDQAGNLFTGLNGAASWTFRTLTVDTTAPVLKTAKMYSNSIIRLTYDELLSSLDPFASSFTVTVNGENRNVSTSYVSGDSVYVVLDTGVAVGQVVRIAYAPGTGTRKIQDLSLNAAAAFSARDVENSLDSIMSKPREGNAYYNTITLYYPETVYISSSDAVRQFSVTADGSGVGISSISTNNSSIVTLNLSRSIQNGEVVQVSYAPGTWPVKDSRGQAFAGFNGFYVRNSIDTKPPEFKSAEVSGTKMWIRYNEPLSRNNKPLKSQYSVLVDGKAVYVNDTDIEDDLITLTLANTVSSTQNVTFSYVPGTLRLTDLNGNPAGYVNLAPVTFTYGNGKILSATLQGDKVYINFRDTLQAQTALTASQFSVQLGGTTTNVLNASISGSIVTLSLSSSATAGQTGTVSYTPGAVPLRDALNNTIAAFGPLALQQNGSSTGSQTTNSRPSWLTEQDASSYGQALLVMSSDTAATASMMSRNNRSTRQFNVDATKLLQAFQYAATSGKTAQPVVFEVPASESSAYVGFPLNTLAQAATSNRTGSIGIKYGDRLWTVPLNNLNVSTMSQSVGGNTTSTDASYLYVQLETVPVSNSGTIDGMLASAGAQKLGNVTDIYLSAFNGNTNQRAEQNFKSQLLMQLPVNTPTVTSGFTYIDPITLILANVPHTFANTTTGVVIKGQINGNQTVVPVTHAVSYQDTASHWAGAVIKELSSKWIIGATNGSFYGPNQTITRAEFAELVAKGLGLKGDQTAARRFRDIRGGDLTSAYIGAAAEAGIITGNTDGTFKPDSAITREQMSIMMVRAMNYGGKTVSLQSSAATTLSKFKDSNKIQSKDSVAKAVQEGIIQGMTSKTFVPQGNATRAQAAVMLKRVLNKLGYL